MPIRSLIGLFRASRLSWSDALCLMLRRQRRKNDEAKGPCASSQQRAASLKPLQRIISMRSLALLKILHESPSFAIR